jgi:hypothetical protein
MRTSSIVLSAILFGAAVVGADELQTTPTTQPSAEQPAQPVASQVRGEVVSVDPEAKVLRLKAQPEGTEPAELSLTVEADAERALADLKAGDSVTATCREGTSGAACVVTAVEKTPSN